MLIILQVFWGWVVGMCFVECLLLRWVYCCGKLFVLYRVSCVALL